MMARVLMRGFLFAKSEKRTLKNGALCVTAIITARDDDHTGLWHIVAFRETVKETLLRLATAPAVIARSAIRIFALTCVGRGLDRMAASRSSYPSPLAI